ncbi:hypothetical protein OMP43_20070 [Sphingomonas sp. CBMAI 2297]|uniref:hypothetical protein n=1 Tax=Sphingomonas sp. CBMAI 2297 TaxID=2991720 RepID=UPI0024575E0E|nr:hypothetical protein [Sphingomonas sp. CBMAI 2297]MDH4746329.1 hypothetical protein [Sphingomonas sp. CBMAI 2297]
MRGAVTGLALLAAACGGPRTTNDPAAQNVIEATSKGVPAKVAAGTCNDKPDFVPVYKEAKIISCTSGDVAATGKRSGTVIYTDFAAPPAILAWSKEQAIASGLTPGIEDRKSFSAADGDRRTLRVMAEPGTAVTNVTVNWGVRR